MRAAPHCLPAAATPPARRPKPPNPNPRDRSYDEARPAPEAGLRLIELSREQGLAAHDRLHVGAGPVAQRRRRAGDGEGRDILATELMRVLGDLGCGSSV
jgi:hypothetical protein